MTQSQVSFPSVTPMLTWAGATSVGRVGDGIVYVWKDEAFHYFGYYPVEREYRLVMTSSRDLGVAQED